MRSVFLLTFNDSIDADRLLVKTMKLERIFGLTLNELEKVVPYDRASILVLTSGHMEFVGGAGWPNLPELTGQRIDLADNEFYGSLVDRRTPLIVRDNVDQAAFPGDPPAGPESQTRLLVPLLFDERAVGLLSLDKHVPGFYTKKHARSAGPYANQVAIALEAARHHQLAQEKLREAEQRRRISESLGDFVALLNSNHGLDDILAYIVTRANHLLQTDACAIYRREVNGSYTCLALRGDKAEALAHPNQTNVRDALRQAAITGQPVTCSIVPEAGATEANQPAAAGHQPPLTEPINPDHTLLALPLHIKRVTFGGLVVYYDRHRLCSAREIELAATFSRQVALAVENARLKSRAEQSAAAAERNRLARELHDAVTQLLFSANALAEALPRLWDRYPEQGRRGLNALRQMTRAALAEMRNLLLELRPAGLTEKKLVELLRQLADGTRGRTQTPVTLTVVGDRRLPAEIQFALYRIAQEALTNAAKHAHASRIKVMLEHLPDQVVLQISDNGDGFDPQTILPDQLGIEIMRERAEVIGAVLSIKSQPGQGTELVVKWPEQQRRDQEEEQREGVKPNSSISGG